MCESVNHRPGFWILAVSQSESSPEDVSEKNGLAPTLSLTVPTNPILGPKEVDTMSENAPTYDELLSKYNEMMDKNKELSEKIASYDNKLNQMDDDLRQARALNTKLMFDDPSVPVQSASSAETIEDTEPETLEQFIDSFAKVAVHNVNLKYGEKIYDDN